MGHTVKREPPTVLNVQADTAVLTNQLTLFHVRQEALHHQEALNANRALLVLIVHLTLPPLTHPVHQDHMLMRHPYLNVWHALLDIFVKLQRCPLWRVKMEHTVKAVPLTVLYVPQDSVVPTKTQTLCNVSLKLMDQVEAQYVANVQ